MKIAVPKDKKFSEATGKLHLPCPHAEKSGVRVHVVIRDGCCYRSAQCMVFQCKHNTIQSDLEKVLSLTW